MIPYENLLEVNKSFTDAFRQQFDDFLSSGWYILGKQVNQFEEQFAKWNESAHCVGVANGLDALSLSLQACAFAPGDEVIVPSNTYIATILSILNNNLTPVLVEPDIRTYNINPELIEQAITPKTRAIMVVHLYGKCCDMDAILAIKNKYNLVLIEDCAQAHGAAYKNQKAGTFGEFGAFSFYPTKNLGALGDAGAVTTSNSQTANIIRQLRNYGSSVKYYNERIGANSRLDELQAAFLNIKLQALDDINNHKRRLAAMYLQKLKSDYILPVTGDDYHDVYHIFNIRHEKRDKLKAYLLENSIGTEIHYPLPPHQQKALLPLFEGRHFPVAEEIHQTTLSLPCSYCHTEADISYIIGKLNSF
ncbi:DegT/DnrJ/EryC1/StrS family aminotransferase [Mucilaginibacter sp. Bleaf8]|uniref:DegT/DnrJ/EryC1/StrS family aminotransferase n=1 Tax=Mucilaginibacter sp. Bleaf8 TaxID=2834430 RepID=UPI001BD17FD0|nr:DegT/DnrJ/EryC1/StrS family aminotransferase [Mucilaginibacter sp. Bleaf8]MBS7564198.1 DegT/DnrJ/EryC1/StrS family aminotransferase [Mucilaginibacter sp. Bleaf8]